ncbi:MAG: VWA domain-containing protein [Candidatus Acidiferrales bacterium]
MRNFTSIGVAFWVVLAASLAIPFPSFSLAAPAPPQQAGPQSPPPPTNQQVPPPPEGQAPAPKGKDDQKKPSYSIQVESNLVNVDVVVTDQNGDVMTGLKRENFRVLDDGQAQIITNFAPTDAPITVAMVMEYSALSYNYFAAKAAYWGSDFLNHLNKEDWVALVTYSMRSTVQVDFTRNKEEVYQSIRTLGFPDFHEANMFDALIDTLDRLQDVKGKKSILLITTGKDTFSKHTLDQTYKRLKQTDISVFCLALAETEHIMADARGASGASQIGYLQARNELETFSKQTGGFAWFPRFDGEIPEIFQNMAAFLRNQYTISFTPSNPAHDGKYHKLKIEVTEPDGSPLNVTNKKGKKMKIQVYAREGYTAMTGEVGDLR